MLQAHGPHQPSGGYLTLDCNGARVDRRCIAVAIVQIVAAATVAHSITLILATLHIVELPANSVETGMVALVALAAIYNLLLPHEDRAYPWGIVFAFGLLRGVKFAVLRASIAASSSAYW